MSDCQHIDVVDRVVCDICGGKFSTCNDCKKVLSICDCLMCDQCGDLVGKDDSVLFKKNKNEEHYFRLCNNCIRELEPVLSDSISVSCDGCGCFGSKETLNRYKIADKGIYTWFCESCFDGLPLYERDVMEFIL